MKPSATITRSAFAALSHRASRAYKPLWGARVPGDGDSNPFTFAPSACRGPWPVFQAATAIAPCYCEASYSTGLPRTGADGETAPMTDVMSVGE